MVSERETLLAEREHEVGTTTLKPISLEPESSFAAFADGLIKKSVDRKTATNKPPAIAVDALINLLFMMNFLYASYILMLIIFYINNIYKILSGFISY